MNAIEDRIVQQTGSTPAAIGQAFAGAGDRLIELIRIEQQKTAFQEWSGWAEHSIRVFLSGETAILEVPANSPAIDRAQIDGCCYAQKENTFHLVVENVLSSEQFEEDPVHASLLKQILEQGRQYSIAEIFFLFYPEDQPNL